MIFWEKYTPVHIHADESVENKEILDSFFATHEEIKAGIIFNSRAHVLGDYFQHQDIDKHFKLIGYDVIESNLSHLNNGYITHLIAQRPEVQGFNCVRALFRHLVLKEKKSNKSIICLLIYLSKRTLSTTITIFKGIN